MKRLWIGGLMLALAPFARAQVFMTESYFLDQFTSSGDSPSQWSSEDVLYPSALAASGNRVFVLERQFGPDDVAIFPVGVAGIGAAAPITGLHGPQFLAASASDLYVYESLTGSISKFSLAGVSENPALVTGLADGSVQGIAVSNSELFVLSGGNTLAAYDFNGNLLSSNLIPGLSGALTLAAAGNDLYVAQSVPPLQGFRVDEYTPAGALKQTGVASGSSVLNNYVQLAAMGHELVVGYTSNAQGTLLISEFTDEGRLLRNDFGARSLIGSILGLAVAGPIFVQQPANVSVGAGQSAAFQAVADGNGPIFYQWSLNGAKIPGATSSHLLVPNVTASGSYVCTATDAAGVAAPSVAAALSLDPSADLGRVSNLSVLASAGTGQANLVAGWIVGGSQPQSLLIRAVGPELAQFGVSSPLADPVLQVFDDGGVSPQSIAQDAGWSSHASAVTAADAQTGAFPLSAGSGSSALVTSVSPGPYSVAISGGSGDSGPALAEIYSLATPAALLNVSARAAVQTSGGLTAGFVVAGSTSKTVLIRAIGPSLSAFGIANPASAPTLTVYQSQGGTTVATNSGWGGDAVLAQASAQVQAFSIPATSADSALLLTLPPGGYSATVTAGGGTAGIGLIEVYVLP